MSRAGGGVLSLLTARVDGSEGMLYLLDEPETGFSPQRVPTRSGYRTCSMWPRPLRSNKRSKNDCDVTGGLALRWIPSRLTVC
jgi:hypothetical protein